MTTKKCEKPTKKAREHVCPYCEQAITVASFPYCQPCGVVLRYCVRCKVAVAREAEVCPQCGGALEWK